MIQKLVARTMSSKIGIGSYEGDFGDKFGGGMSYKTPPIELYIKDQAS